jgi:hypothetical protein
MAMIYCLTGTARAPLSIRSQAKGSLRPSARRLALVAHPLRARSFARSGRFAPISPVIVRSLMVRLAHELRGLFQAPRIDSKRCIFLDQRIFSLFSTPELRKQPGRRSNLRRAHCSLIQRRPAGIAALARYPLNSGGFLFPRSAGSAAPASLRALLRCGAKKRDPLSRPCSQGVAKNARDNAFFARLSRSARQVARPSAAAILPRIGGQFTAKPRQISDSAAWSAMMARSSHHTAALCSLRSLSASSLRSTCSALTCSHEIAKNAHGNAFFARLCSFAARVALPCADAVLSRIGGQFTAKPRQSSDSTACSAISSSTVLGSANASHGFGYPPRLASAPSPLHPPTPQTPGKVV